MSRERLPNSEDIERERGRRQADTTSRTAARSLRCQVCGEVRKPSALLSMDDVALRLGTSIRHVRRLVAERRIPIVKVGHFVRFDSHELEHWVDDRRVSVVERAAVLRQASHRQVSSREGRRRVG